MEQKRVYRVVNVLVLLLAAGLFVNSFIGSKDTMRVSLRSAAILVLTAAIVHGLKAFRLYFALYGKHVSFGEHLIQYCKVTVVSMSVPFKLGDIFRAYCYGYQMSDYLGGAALIVLDRFADMLALVTVVLVMQVIYASEVTMLLYVLFVVLLGFIAAFLVFPGMYRYWKKYFLRLAATKGRNHLIRILDCLNHAYSELGTSVKGKGIILYVLSLAAWTAEAGGLAFSGGILSGRKWGYALSEYLVSALAGTGSVYLKQFVLVSMVLMFSLYLVLRFTGSLGKGT